MGNGLKASQAKQQTTVTLAVGQTQTPEANIKGDLVGIFVGALTGTTLTFQVSDAKGGTFVNLIDSAGNAVSVTVAANKYLSFTADQIARFRGIENLKITSGTQQATAVCPFILITKGNV